LGEQRLLQQEHEDDAQLRDATGVAGKSHARTVCPRLNWRSVTQVVHTYVGIACLWDWPRTQIPES
jgi:hypothetical protein